MFLIFICIDANIQFDYKLFRTPLNPGVARNRSYDLIKNDYDINNDTDKASNLLKESVKNLEYPNLKTEAYIMLAHMETDSKKAMRLLNSAQKATISQTEKNYISILKAKRMINDNNKEGALEILDAIELENNAYKEMFEHTYGMASALN